MGLGMGIGALRSWPRAWLLFTCSPALRRVATILNLKSVNLKQFIETRLETPRPLLRCCARFDRPIKSLNIPIV